LSEDFAKVRYGDEQEIAKQREFNKKYREQE